MVQVAGRVGFPIYSLLPPFEQSTEFPLYARDDPHWNQAGIALAAGAVAMLALLAAGGASLLRRVPDLRVRPGGA